MQPCQTALKSKGAGLGGGWDVYSNGCHNECLQRQALASVGWGGLCASMVLKENSHCSSPGRLARRALHNLLVHTNGTKDLEITAREISHHMLLITCPLFTVFKPWTSNTSHKTVLLWHPPPLKGPCLLKIYFYKLSCCRVVSCCFPLAH